MKWYSARLALLWLGFLAIPLTYNSCQKGLLGSGGFASSTKSCKATLLDGKVEKTFIDSSLPPEPFRNKKVKLREDLNSSDVRAKASGPMLVRAGTRLGVLVDNACLTENTEHLPDTVISLAAAESADPIPGLDRQTYEWVLDRDYTDDEIDDLASREGCVIGISWNQTYQMQAAYNDPNGLEQMSYLNSIRALQAYDSFYKSASFPGGMDMNGTMANSVKIAVVDSGVDWQHPDLINNMWAHTSGVGIDITTACSGCGPINYNPFDISNIGHGTHVAGMIAASTNNALGIIGAMPFRARIMAIKLFSLNEQQQLTTTSQHFANAVRFAYLNGASVINLSLGAVTAGAASDALAESAVTDAVNNKAVVVTVIGNAEGAIQAGEINGTSLSSIPAQYSTRPGVIGVGSIDASSGQKSSFSHYSTTYAEIGAPGAEQGTQGLYSTKPRTMSAYGRLAGTSQAAPLVSAAAGLTIGLIKEAYGLPPDPSEVESLILNSAVKSPTLNTYFKSGNRLDFMNLVAAIGQKYPLTRTGGKAPVQGCP